MAFRRGGFSFVEHGLEMWTQESWRIGSVAPWHVESSRSRDQTHVPPPLASRFLTTGLPGKDYCLIVSGMQGIISIPCGKIR